LSETVQSSAILPFSCGDAGVGGDDVDRGDLDQQAGHRLLLAAETLETDDDLARLLDAVGAEERFLVRLEAQPATLVELIIEREPESWSGLAGLVEHTQVLAATMPALRGVDLVLSSEGQRPEAVAPHIRAALPQRGVAPLSSAFSTSSPASRLRPPKQIGHPSWARRRLGRHGSECCASSDA
jgi:hypothetical protein